MLFLLAAYLCKRFKHKLKLNTLFQRIQKRHLPVILQPADNHLVTLNYLRHD